MVSSSPHSSVTVFADNALFSVLCFWSFGLSCHVQTWHCRLAVHNKGTVKREEQYIFIRQRPLTVSHWLKRQTCEPCCSDSSVTHNTLPWVTVILNDRLSRTRKKHATLKSAIWINIKEWDEEQIFLPNLTCRIFFIYAVQMGNPYFQTYTSWLIHVCYCWQRHQSLRIYVEYSFSLARLSKALHHLLNQPMHTLGSQLIGSKSLFCMVWQCVFYQTGWHT